MLSASPANATLLAAAAGGGGASFYAPSTSIQGQAGTSGQAGGGSLGGAGGSGGTGGGGGNVQGGGGGAGFSTAGSDAGTRGGAGGASFPSFAGGAAYGGGVGGFGGGGGAGLSGGGGGGGYSGGGGGAAIGGAGGGGGSYLDPSFTNVTETSGANAGAGYVTLSLGGIVQSFAYTGSIQETTIAATGLYSLTIAGAQGGTFYNNPYVGGLGALLSGTVTLAAGTVLDVVVGGMGGTNNNFGAQGGGGGGSFVYSADNAAVPEPGSLGLLAPTALAALGLIRRRLR